MYTSSRIVDRQIQSNQIKQQFYVESHIIIKQHANTNLLDNRRDTHMHETRHPPEYKYKL